MEDAELTTKARRKRRTKKVATDGTQMKHGWESEEAHAQRRREVMKGGRETVAKVGQRSDKPRHDHRFAVEPVAALVANAL